MVATLVFGLVMVTTADAFAYRTLAEREGTAAPVVWTRYATVGLDLETLPNSERGVFERELNAAVSVWNAVECKPALLQPDLALGASADIVVRWVDEWTSSGFDADAAATTEVALASRPDGTVEITAATIFINGGFVWGTHPQGAGDTLRDTRAVLVHELGHAWAGLLHPCGESDTDACGPGDEALTMHPVYQGASQARLSSDELEGVCELYGSFEPPLREPDCESDQECGFGEWCMAGNCVGDARYGEPCDRGDDCPAGVCVATEEGGVCTFPCAQPEECPAGTACTAVSGSDPRSVCAPIQAEAGCSVSPGTQGSAAEAIPVAMFTLTFLLALRRRFSTGKLLAPLFAGALFCLGCSGDPGSDAGPPADADTPGLDATPDTGVDSGPPPEECAPIGDTRVATCGFCGNRGEECSAAGVWEPTGECLGQGECAVGTTEEEDLGMCATRQRLCLDECMWGDWEDVAPAGECEPGETRLLEDGCSDGAVREETCTDACAWEETRACHDPCGGTPRLSPEWKAEVCVPAGNFFRGSTDFADAQPVQEVFVSSFYIDRYPVTNQRYRECVETGPCEPPPFATPGRDSYQARTPPRPDHPVQNVPRSQATAFCAWDGGRRLPTEGEWEKALRGPAPRMNLYPWEGETYPRCDLVENFDCGYRDPSLRLGWAPDPYYGVPGSRSFYGTYLQYGGVREWVSDWYSATYYADPSSLSDPQGPLSGGFLTRGVPRAAAGALTQRTEVMDDAGGLRSGFRCARSVP
ncbi:MAG: hypothetical protein SangKO_073850 [Sandaracinaceae bacterium]